MPLPLREHHNKVAELFTELSLGDPYGNRAPHVIGFLLEASPGLVERIAERCRESHDEHDLWKLVLRSSVLPKVGESHDNYVDSMMRIVEVGALAVSIRSMTARNVTSPYELLDIIEGTHVNMICNSRETNLRLVKAAILVSAIGKEVEDVVPAEIEILRESANYVVDHLKAVEQLFPELVKRRFIQKEEIALLVENESKQMSSGVL